MEARSPVRLRDRFVDLHVDLITKAAYRQNEAALTELLKKDISINLTDTLGDTAVFLCAREQRTEAVNFLLSRGASINDAIKGYAWAGCLAQVSDLLKMGARVRSALNGFYYAAHSDDTEADLMSVISASFPHIEPARIARLALRRKVMGLGYRGEDQKALNYLPEFKESVGEFYWLLAYGLADGMHSDLLLKLFESNVTAAKHLAENVREKLIGKLLDRLALHERYAEVEDLLKRQASKHSAVRAYALLGDEERVKTLIDKATDCALLDAAAMGYAQAGEHQLAMSMLAAQAQETSAIRGYARAGFLKPILAMLNSCKELVFADCFKAAIDVLLAYEHTVVLDQVIAACQSRLNDSVQKQLVNDLYGYYYCQRIEARRRFLAFCPHLTELLKPALIKDDAFGDEAFFLAEVGRLHVLMQRGYTYTQACVVSQPSYLKIARLAKNETEFFETMRANFSVPLSPSDLQEIYLPGKVSAYKQRVLDGLLGQAAYTNLRDAVTSAKSLDKILAELDRYQKLPSQVRLVRDELASHLDVDLPERESYVDQSSSSSSSMVGKAARLIHGLFAGALPPRRVAKDDFESGDENDHDFGAPSDRFYRPL